MNTAHLMWYHFWAAWTACPGHRLHDLEAYLRWYAHGQARKSEFPGYHGSAIHRYARWCLDQFGTGRRLYWALRPW